MKKVIFLLLLLILASPAYSDGWIRINQAGYLPVSVKVAVYISTETSKTGKFSLRDALTGKELYSGIAIHYSGADWGMRSAARLDFTKYEKPGGYYLEYNGIKSPVFKIDAGVYSGLTDYVLRYMRQQRCGYNPWLDDSCHTHDGFIVDHPTKTGKIIDARGGWHDASDYLQYVTTSANAVYQMLYAWQKAPEVHGDTHDASGRLGKNGIPDILDEALWGIDWLLKMNPDSGEMYNQIADDRDHRGFRLPNLDTASYGFGKYRPVYFVTGKPQGLAKFKNRTEGVASTAGKYASAFALAATVFKNTNPDLANKLAAKAIDAWEFGLTEPGATQTACNVSPYFYEEENYTDDLELAAWELFRMSGDSTYLVKADYWGSLEPVTPWIEKDTARHYQFYPFVNMGHANIGESSTKYSDKYLFYMRKGLKILQERRKSDPFRVTIPFTWCSNNFVNAALTQHMIYREKTGDKQFIYEEAALRDWLFGCNPWGTSMICGYPEGGDYPRFPHSAFTLHLGITVDGGLIDGPVYDKIYKGLKGVTLLRPDTYSVFQNGKVVYHDDIGDYSTNEPTMDGTADLTIPLAMLEKEGRAQESIPEGLVRDEEGAIIRIDRTSKNIYLVFSADELFEGMDHVLDVLYKHGAGGSFFLTGNFLRNKSASSLVKRLVNEGHMTGPHSDKHLLYNSWEKRDSLLVTKAEFLADLKANYAELEKKGVRQGPTRWFLAPYEWYNKAIASWAADLGVTLINLTPGTATNADYTTPDSKNYRKSDYLVEALKQFEKRSAEGLNGAIILIHPGTEASRTDKLYNRLDEMMTYYESLGYTFKRLQ
ncbi:MAG: glycoside hydrolase family 9 protein [Bacteroidales bacterium]